MPLADDQVPPGADWLTQRLERIERAITELRAARASSATSFIGGAFRLLDDDRETRFAAGKVDIKTGTFVTDSPYGTMVFGDDNAIVFLAQEGFRGLVFPQQPIPLHPPAVVNVTSASFVTLWESNVGFPAWEVVHVASFVDADAGTSGEIRLREAFSGQTTDPIVVPAGQAGDWGFRWVHPAISGLYDNLHRDTGELFVVVEARRTAGAGNLVVWPPSRALLCSRKFALTADTSGDPATSWE